MGSPLTSCSQGYRAGVRSGSRDDVRGCGKSCCLAGGVSGANCRDCSRHGRGHGWCGRTTEH